MRLELIAAHVYFDMPTEQMVADIAQLSMKQGLESNSLTDLASGVYDISIKESIKQTFKELDVDFPTHEEAGLLLAKHYAEMIVNTSLDAYEGAKKIWLEIEADEEDKHEFETLRVFAGLASEYEDFSEEAQIEFYGEQECSTKQAEIKKAILEEARMLIDRY